MRLLAWDVAETGYEKQGLFLLGDGERGVGRGLLGSPPLRLVSNIVDW